MLVMMEGGKDENGRWEEEIDMDLISVYINRYIYIHTEIIYKKEFNEGR